MHADPENTTQKQTCLGNRNRLPDVRKQRRPGAEAGGGGGAGKQGGADGREAAGAGGWEGRGRWGRGGSEAGADGGAGPMGAGPMGAGADGGRGRWEGWAGGHQALAGKWAYRSLRCRVELSEAMGKNTERVYLCAQLSHFAAQSNYHSINPTLLL